MAHLSFTPEYSISARVRLTNYLVPDSQNGLNMTAAVVR